jgi:hypothetical protein
LRPWESVFDHPLFTTLKKNRILFYFVILGDNNLLYNVAKGFARFYVVFQVVGKTNWGEERAEKKLNILFYHLTLYDSWMNSPERLDGNGV